MTIYDSSMISEIDYDYDEMELMVTFTKSYFIKHPKTFIDVPLDWYEKFINAPSVGKFYLQYITKLFQTKNQTTMSEDQKKKRIGKNRASNKTRFIELNIDVDKIIKDWLYIGEKGKYLKLTFALKPDGEVDKFQNCGMVTQTVPQDVYKADKETKGPILGNGYEADWDAMRGEGSSGSDLDTAKRAGTLDPNEVTEPLDDLPF